MYSSAATPTRFPTEMSSYPYPCIYIRRPFSMEKLNDVAALILEIQNHPFPHLPSKPLKWEKLHLIHSFSAL